MLTSTAALRVAIAGCHRMLDTLPRGHNWAQAFDSVPETDVVAVFDVGGDTREEFQSVWKDRWGDIPGYDDYDKMLAETKPDIVCITTRQTMHVDQIESALASGVKGIACEKPFVTSVSESDRIIAACRKAGAPLIYLLDRRWNTRYQKICEVIGDGVIGEVIGVSALGLPNLINHGCHFYDMALALAGDVEPIWTSGHVDDVSQDPEDSRRRLDPPGRSWTGLSNGAHIMITPEGIGRATFSVYGTEGSIVIQNDAETAVIWDTDGGTVCRSVELPDRIGEWPEGHSAVSDLANAVKNGGNTACDVDEARRATEIGFAIHASHAENGKRVTLPLVDRSLRIESFPWGNE